jgi:hypothetical protein
MIVYKLVSQKKNGEIGPLFINRKQRFKIGEWMEAGCYPTKGFKVRPGFHTTPAMYAPHLSEKDRVWVKVEIEDYREEHRPLSQGGLWFLSNRMKVLEVIDAEA